VYKVNIVPFERGPSRGPLQHCPTSLGLIGGDLAIGNNRLGRIEHGSHRRGSAGASTSEFSRAFATSCAYYRVKGERRPDKMKDLVKMGRHYRLTGLREFPREPTKERGEPARAKKLTTEEQSEIGKMAAKARSGKREQPTVRIIHPVHRLC